jgi:hypothetical protein
MLLSLNSSRQRQLTCRITAVDKACEKSDHVGVHRVIDVQLDNFVVM